MPASWFLKHCDWRHELREDASERVRARATFLPLVTGQILFGPESPGGFVYLLEEGRLRLCRFDQAGREVVRGILEEGDLLVEPLGLEGAKKKGYATALEATRVLRLELGEFEELERQASSKLKEALQRAREGRAFRG